MRIQVAVPEEHVQPDVIDAVLEGVTRLDERLIRSGQSPTSHELIARGAVWRPEPLGDEHFDHGTTIQRRGWGDCDDWAPLHAATLRATGEDPGAIARVVPSGPSTYHAIVERSNGAIDDPSIAAGMKPRAAVAGDASIHVMAHDPHDGRIYEGQLLPTTAPLWTPTPGPAIAVRGCVVGGESLYEARCDLPLRGSRIVHVHAPHRHPRPRGRRNRPMPRVVGVLPYALSVTSLADTAEEALSTALVGASVLADASDLATRLDRYKLLAVHMGLSGMSPGQVHDAISAHIHDDLAAHAAATGSDPGAHVHALLEHAAATHGAVVGYIGGLFSGIAHLAHEVVHSVTHVVNDVAHVVKAIPWGSIIHDVQAAVSVVPILGTAASDVIATAESAYDAAAAALSGNPLEGAIQAAYNFALGTVPGGAALHGILDPVVHTLLAMTVGHEPLESAALDQVLGAVPDAPKLGHLSPRSIAASLAHTIVGKRGLKHTGQGRPVTASRPQPHPTSPGLVAPAMHPAATMHPAAAAATAARPTIRMAAPKAATAAAPPPPAGVPHAAVHTTELPPAQPKLATRVAGQWIATPAVGGWRFGWC